MVDERRMNFGELWKAMGRPGIPQEAYDESEQLDALADRCPAEQMKKFGRGFALIAAAITTNLPAQPCGEACRSGREIAWAITQAFRAGHTKGADDTLVRLGVKPADNDKRGRP